MLQFRVIHILNFFINNIVQYLLFNLLSCHLIFHWCFQFYPAIFYRIIYTLKYYSLHISKNKLLNTEEQKILLLIN